VARATDAATDRTDAAADRTDAATDRAAAAADRATDRVDRATDRVDRATDRAAAATDREIAADDQASASLDELTGAHRRGAGLAELEREIARSRRTGEPLVVAYVDVDGLKTVNDTRGHAAGDRVLCELVRALRGQLRQHDLIVRVGGDEFVCVLPGGTIPMVSERFAAVSAELMTLPERLSISVGLAQPEGNETAADLVLRADAALLHERAQREESRHHPGSGHP
jgi:diguanylate cyclase (GGDEF)-like protein